VPKSSGLARGIARERTRIWSMCMREEAFWY
jgi:hypothetical protein